MGKIISFEGVDGYDVYNPTAPFKVNGVEYMAARVEKRNIFWQDFGYDPQIVFFIKNKHSWAPAKNVPTISMEDPFKTFISGELIFGGVKVYGEPRKRKFRTVFLRGNCPRTLKEFSCGPEMMKDVRLIQLLNGEIGIFTRPQGGEFGRGRIGFTIVKSLQDVNAKNIAQAKIIRKNFLENQWEGVNSAKLLENGSVDVLAHQASIKENGKKKYVATSFILEPRKIEITDFKIIATRDDFPPAPAKTPFLEDVLFPGEIDCNHLLWAGVVDTFVGVKKIPSTKILYKEL